MSKLTFYGRRVIAMIVAITVIAGGDLNFAEEIDAEALEDSHFGKERTASLIRELNAESTEKRIQAVDALWKIGPEARPAIPTLIRLLTDDAYVTEFAMARDVVSDKAAGALTSIGPEAVGPLCIQYGRLPESAQQKAIFLARQMGSKARAMLPQFVERYELKGNKKPTGLLDAIAAIDPSGETAIPVLVRQLQKGESDWERRDAAIWLTNSDTLEVVYWQEQAPAARWFRRRPSDATAVENALLAAIGDQSPEVRGPAALAISTYPDAAKRSAPSLLKLLNDNEYYSVAYSNHVGGEEAIASAAAEGLSRLSSQADQILPALIKSMSIEQAPSASVFADLILCSSRPLDHVKALLDGPHPELTLVAAARLGPVAGTMIPQIEALRYQIYERQRDEIRIESKLAVACIDPKGRLEVAATIEQWGSREVPIVCGFLQQVGPRGEYAIPFLLQRMHDKEVEGELEWDVTRTLEAMGPAAVAAAPTVIKCLDTGYEFYSDDKENALVAFGPQVVPMLIDALQAPGRSPKHRKSCLHVLGRFGTKSADAVPSVLAQLDSTYPRVREAAVTALGQIASRHGESLPSLVKKLSDPRPFVRAAATESCGAFGPDAASVVPALVKQLSDDYLDVQLAAATALGQLGPTAKQALPDLERLQSTDNVLLRDTVREAIATIKP